ncbi:MAG: hypothetical protein ABEI98_01580 [Halorhabdus sp.]
MSSSGVPTSGSIISNAGTYRTIAAYLGAIFGGIGLAFTYLVIKPVRETAIGLGAIINNFLAGGIAFLLKQIPFQMGSIIQSGGQASSAAVASEGIIGFILAFIIVIAGVTVFQQARDKIWDGLPFLSWVPLFGDTDED